MPTQLDYAQLSSRVYADVRNPNNKPFLPFAWTDLSSQFGVGSGPTADGFSAGVFRDGNDIVISYAGTSPDGSNSAADWATNLITGVGGLGPQVLNAALLYEQVKQQYGGSQYHISFTGHSLGGGLASMMSVMFNQPATTFDLAPFGLAINPVNLTAVTAYLATQGYVDADLAILLASTIASSAILPVGSTLLQLDLVERYRERRITNYALNGEVLSFTRTPFNTLGSMPTTVNSGDQQLSLTDRHSMSLLLAAQNVGSFRIATLALPTLLPLMFDQSLYAANVTDPTGASLDFLERLVRYQFPYQAVGYEHPDDMLNHFGQDMERIAQTGVASIDQVRKGLIIAGIEYYNFVNPTQQIANFFNSAPGGISFDLSTINGLPLAQQLGYAQLRAYVQQAYNLQATDPALAAVDATGLKGPGSIISASVQ